MSRGRCLRSPRLDPCILDGVEFVWGLLGRYNNNVYPCIENARDKWNELSGIRNKVNSTCRLGHRIVMLRMVVERCMQQQGGPPFSPLWCCKLGQYGRPQFIINRAETNGKGYHLHHHGLLYCFHSVSRLPYRATYKGSRGRGGIPFHMRP